MPSKEATLIMQLIEGEQKAQPFSAYTDEALERAKSFYCILLWKAGIDPQTVITEVPDEWRENDN